MTKIKLCGMMRTEDIAAAMALRSDYVGFVFEPKSRRYLTRERAEKLKALLPEEIPAVGVFVDEAPEMVVELLSAGVIDMAQLHGHENEAYIRRLREMTGKPVIRAFQIHGPRELEEAEKSAADALLLDAGAGSGVTFDWSWLRGFPRPYFLAGGLSPENAEEAVRTLHPFGVDVSSGVETNGHKDPVKMCAFMEMVRKAEKQERGRP